MIDPQKLHQEFVRLGSMRLKLKNRMLAILPAIYKSGIYKKYANSIEEYAGKYGDIGKTTVAKRLRLENNLEDKPLLQAAIEKVGVHKIAMIAKIATPQTDQMWADRVLNMSKQSVQSLSKEMRAWQQENTNDRQQLAFSDDSVDGNSAGYVSTNQNQAPFCKAVTVIKKIDLDEDSTFLFIKLKAKLGKNLNDKEFIKLILEERLKQEFPEVKSRTKIADQKSITGDTFIENRYIPSEKKRQIIAQTNGKCAYPNCNLPYRVLHHIDRYSENKNHDSVIPLCKIHHEFAHNNLIQNEKLKTNEWKILIIKPPTTEISQADILYRKYRREALP